MIVRTANGSYRARCRLRGGRPTERGNLRWIYASRALRSFSTAFLTVVFPLYLAAEGYRSAQIGLVLAVGGVATAALVATVGVLSDLAGRRRMLLGLAAMGAAGSVLMAVTGNFVAVTAASGLAGVGRGGGAGSGGAWGPIFPAEQPLLTAAVDARHRTEAFGTIGFVGVLAGAAGSLVAWVPDGLHSTGWTWLAAYRVVFWLGAVVAAIMFISLLPIREPGAGAEWRRRREGAAATGSVPVTPPAGPPARQTEPAPAEGFSTRQLVGRLALTNAINGLGIGFLGPLLTYWFHVRYGVGPGQLGVLYTIINLMTALPYLGAARLVQRLGGAVRTVLIMRGASAALMLGMVWTPTFALAGLVYALRMVTNSLSLPARQSYTMGVAEERRRGMVAAVGMLPALGTSTISPAVGGALMESFLDAPLVGAAFFMGCQAVVYYFVFRHVKPPEERDGLALNASR